MTNKINFHEIDKNGNHVMRLVGGDQEHRINLMTASEDMYEALKAMVALIVSQYLALMKSYSYELMTEALAKAEK